MRFQSFYKMIQKKIVEIPDSKDKYTYNIEFNKRHI